MLPMVTMPLTTAPLGDLSVRRRSTVQGRSSPVSMGEQEALALCVDAGALDDPVVREAGLFGVIRVGYPLFGDVVPGRVNIHCA